ncbi:MAG: hypothetical protein WD066_13175 [Planctomycetaceae bacterium]
MLCKDIDTAAEMISESDFLSVHHLDASEVLGKHCYMIVTGFFDDEEPMLVRVEIIGGRTEFGMTHDREMPWSGEQIKVRPFGGLGSVWVDPSQLRIGG